MRTTTHRPFPQTREFLCNPAQFWAPLAPEFPIDDRPSIAFEAIDFVPYFLYSLFGGNRVATPTEVKSKTLKIGTSQT
jgi:hypothetical protein